MTDFTHLNAIQERLFRARERFETAKAGQARDWHAHEVKMIEREEASEYEFLGIVPQSLDEVLSDSDLLGELVA